MPWWERLLSWSYWIGSDAGPLTMAGGGLHLVLALGFAGLAAWVLMARGRRSSLWRGLTVAVCAVGLGIIGLRLAGVVGWARLGVAASMVAALGLVAIPVWLLPVWPQWHAAWRAFWTFAAPPLPLSRRASGLLLVAHLANLLIVTRLLWWPFWSAPLLLAMLLLPEASRSLLVRRQSERISWPGLTLTSLNALFPVGLLALVEAARFMAMTLCAPAIPPLPLFPALAVAAGGAVAYQLRWSLPAQRRIVALALPASLLAAVVCWATWAYLSLYARGVTGSDPYGYVQMAVDLARSGTLLHAFPLAAEARSLGLPVEPFLHVGYREPLDFLGRAATVWPAGHSVLLGLAGRAFGEGAIYLATPLLGLASVFATCALGGLLFSAEPLLRPGKACAEHLLAGALAALLVATSYEQLRWLLVHMADISAQLFSVLTVLLAWLAGRGEPGLRRQWLWAAGAGLCLALAYWARHTQLAMIVPALAALVLGRACKTGPRWRSHLEGVATPGVDTGRREGGCPVTGSGGPTSRRRILPMERRPEIEASNHILWPVVARQVAIFLGVALLGALPDLAYHARLFGSPFRPESRELSLYTLRAVPATTLLLVKGWLALPELGLLAPFLIFGVAALVRRHRPAAIVLGLWLFALWAVQAPYRALRPRDLLPALPALAILAACGLVVAVRWLSLRSRSAAVTVALAVALLLWLRSAGTVAKPARRDFDNFGYLWATQVAAFASLRDLTPPAAVIGATLNSGAIDLYGQRAAYRPEALAPADLERWLRACWAKERPTFLLDDGDAMQPVLADVARYARLTPAGLLCRIPRFNRGAGSVVGDAILYRVEP